MDEDLIAVEYASSGRFHQRARLLERWLEGPRPWYEWLREHGAIESDSQVLDIGCGPGLHWQEAAGASVIVLTDASIGMVREAMQSTELTLGLVTDAESLALRERSFDLVAAHNVLYHLSHPEAAIADIGRVMRRDGRFVCATIGHTHLMELTQLHESLFGKIIVDNPADRFGRVSGRPLLQGLFRDVRWVQYPGRVLCRSPDDVANFMTSFSPLAEARPRTLERLRESIQRLFGEDGALELTVDSGTFICEGPRFR